MSTVPQRLRECRRHLNLTQRDMAERIGVAFRSWQDYEAGRRKPGSQVIAALVNQGFNGTWLMSGQGEPMLKTPASEGLAVIGLAECGLQGWFQEGELAVRTACPPDLATDPQAFAVMAAGTSMQPDGIRPGYICLCTPSASPKQGEAVYVEDHKNRAALKIFIQQDETWLTLKGWLAPETDGRQKPYIDQRRLSEIRRIAPVIYVKRRL